MSGPAMKEHTQQRPDPVLPEHQLIRSAAVLPVLSVSLKSDVMAGCLTEIRWTRWKFRVKVSVTAIAACGLMFMLQNRLREQAPSAEPRAEISEQFTPPAFSPSTNSKYATDQLSPVSPEGRRDVEQIHKMIEQLQQREKKLCGLIPWL